MSFIDPKTKQINCKIVYCGPVLSGKATTIWKIFQEMSHSKNGMATLSHNRDRTLFFDFLPLSLGKVKGYDIRVHVYSIPGPILYDASRRLILKGVDGIVFVADSKLNRLEENISCLSDLGQNLNDQDIDLEDIPMVFQYNKRDLTKTRTPLHTLEQSLNPGQRPSFESVASKGKGIMEPLKDVTKWVLKELHNEA
jgi:mutual gliding-motility protein MglA